MKTRRTTATATRRRSTGSILFHAPRRLSGFALIGFLAISAGAGFGQATNEITLVDPINVVNT